MGDGRHINFCVDSWTSKKAVIDSLIGDSRAVDRKRSVAEFIDDNRAFTLDALRPFLPADMLFVTLRLLNPESINSTSPTHSSRLFLESL